MKKLKNIHFKLKYYNFRLIFFIISLTLLGIIVIGSAAPGQNYQMKQLIGMILGAIIMLALSVIDYRFLLNLHWIEYGVCVFLLILVLIPGVGKNGKGAQRWIPIGSDSGINIQPSEFAKILMILFWAWLYGKNQDNIKKWKNFLISSLFTLLVMGLIVKEPDLSTTILMLGLFFGVLFISGFSYKKFGIIFAIAVPILVGAIIYIQTPNQKLLRDYQLNRILSFINPDKYDDLRYQQDNAVLAIGSGELYGKGLYNDSSDSVKNGNYIAEPQTDFIFSIVGEEMGFVGSCIVLGLLLAITIECIITGARALDMPGRIICFGMAALIALQTFINIGVVTEILPNTGIPLPFFSYGLSSLVTIYAGMGLVLSVRITKKTVLEETMNEYRFNRT